MSERHPYDLPAHIREVRDKINGRRAEGPGDESGEPARPSGTPRPDGYVETSPGILEPATERTAAIHGYAKPDADLLALGRGLAAITPPTPEQHSADPTPTKTAPDPHEQHLAARRRKIFLAAVDRLVEYWQREPGPTVDARIRGVAFSILAMVDGCSGVNNFRPLSILDDGVEINRGVELHEEFAQMRHERRSLSVEPYEQFTCTGCDCTAGYRGKNHTDRVQQAEQDGWRFRGAWLGGTCGRCSSRTTRGEAPHGEA